jgi:hypothetical protein
VNSEVCRVLNDWWLETTEDDRRLWRRWLKTHGINPDDVSANPCRVERHVDDCRIVYTSFKRDPEGQIMLTPDREEVQLVDVMVQLEAAPMPFPTP